MSHFGQPSSLQLPLDDSSMKDFASLCSSTPLDLNATPFRRVDHIVTIIRKVQRL